MQYISQYPRRNEDDEASCGRAVKPLFSWAKSSEFEPCLDISVEVTSQC